MATTNATVGRLTTDPQEATGDSLVYVIGGVTAGCIFLAALVAYIFWRKHPRKTSECDLEATFRKGEEPTVGISETQRRLRTHPGEAEGDRDSISSRPEAVALNPTPDIITAHDNDSIYETLDGRRAARARAAAADHVTDEQANRPIRNDPHSSSANGGDGSTPDTTYDHLSRYNSSFPGQRRVLPPGVAPGPRLTISDDVERLKFQPQHPLTHPPHHHHHHHNTDEFSSVVRGGGRHYKGTRRFSESVLSHLGASDGMVPESWDMPLMIRRRDPASASASLLNLVGSSSTLTRVARESCADGKRIVCQLTVVGVVEEGEEGFRSLPLLQQQHDHQQQQQQRRTNAAYFVLEPRRELDPSSLHNGGGGGGGGIESQSSSPGSTLPSAGQTRFQIQGQLDAGTTGQEACLDAAGGGGRRGGCCNAVSGRSEYFVLEPLQTSQQHDAELNSLTCAASSTPSRRGEEEGVAEWRGKGRGGGSQAADPLNNDDDQNSLRSTVCPSRGVNEGGRSVGGGGTRGEREGEVQREGEGGGEERGGKEEGAGGTGVGDVHANRTSNTKPASFRSQRLHSCPSSTSRDTREASPPLDSSDFQRSFSSPQSDLRRQHPNHHQTASSDDNEGGERRLDAETLKARIQREMVAMGFIKPAQDDGYAVVTGEGDDSKPQQQQQQQQQRQQQQHTDESCGGVATSDSARCVPRAPPQQADVRSPRNEYFILEPRHGDASSDDDEDRIFKPSNSSPRATSVRDLHPSTLLALRLPLAGEGSKERPAFQRQNSPHDYPPRSLPADDIQRARPAFQRQNSPHDYPPRSLPAEDSQPARPAFQRQNSPHDYPPRSLPAEDSQPARPSFQRQNSPHDYPPRSLPGDHSHQERPSFQRQSSPHDYPPRSLPGDDSHQERPSFQRQSSPHECPPRSLPGDDSHQERPSFQRQHTTQGCPPRLPQRPPALSRGGHNRSRSDTSGFKSRRGSRDAAAADGRRMNSEEQGPVVVSLRKTVRTKSVDE